MLASSMFLISLLLIISSRPFISIAMTDKWMPSVPLMKLFFMEGLLFPLLVFNQNILCSIGRSGLSLKIDIIKKLLVLVSIILLFRIGIEALIIGQVITTGIALVISTAAVRKTQDLRLRGILVPLAKLCIIMGACLLLSYFIIDPLEIPDWVELLLKCTLVPLIFWGSARLLGLEALNEIKIFLHDFKLQHLK